MIFVFFKGNEDLCSGDLRVRARMGITGTHGEDGKIKSVRIKFAQSGQL